MTPDAPAIDPNLAAEHRAREIRAALGLITEDELAKVLLLNSVGTLATWRSQNSGPRSLKLGKRVFYTLNFLGNWMNDVANKQANDASQPDTKAAA